jgi:hypothetical protein
LGLKTLKINTVFETGPNQSLKTLFSEVEKIISVAIVETPTFFEAVHHSTRNMGWWFS